jgi:hypothetical protein
MAVARWPGCSLTLRDYFFRLDWTSNIPRLDLRNNTAKVLNNALLKYQNASLFTVVARGAAGLIVADHPLS